MEVSEFEEIGRVIEELRSFQNTECSQNREKSTPVMYDVFLTILMEISLTCVGDGHNRLSKISN